MADFSIEIVPPLPPAGTATPYAGEVAELWRGPLPRHGEIHQIIYRLGGEMYAYYPANILVVLGDLEGEAETFASARSHYVELCGYAVAYARCRDGRVWFCDPPQQFGTEDDLSLVGDGASLQAVVEALRASAAQVRGYIGALLT
jgi:hypothetical protein